MKIPNGWTCLVHGSSQDKWEETKLGEDFTVGQGVVAGHSYPNRNLCCIDLRNGLGTANTYGGREAPLQIRVLIPDDPRRGNRTEGLNEKETRELSRYYHNPYYRHPIVPSGTKLHALGETTSQGTPVYYYVPESYQSLYEQTCQKEEGAAFASAVSKLETEIPQKGKDFPSLGDALESLPQASRALVR